MNFPDCKSENINKNGSNSSGKQKFICKSCGRQFVENPEYRKIGSLVIRVEIFIQIKQFVILVFRFIPITKFPFLNNELP
ncbi:IS1/IS1595 family N-terminal zinc-binding domain-containing protein [Desulfonema ishimotonii]|uniref:IS1/IS1595 family N-terminal zinc-binding domain-containing protein n=1 Tax=Desulfonema ishimotonii TaxID=45657 RepID=UPI000F577AA8